MNLTRKRAVAAVVVASVCAGRALSIALDSWRWSLGLLGALALLLSGIILTAVRRQGATQKAALERIERKIDTLAVRVVTESQATHRELGGLIEELGSSLRRTEQPKA